MRVTVYLWGCHDTTEFTIDVTQEEVGLLERLSKISEEVSTYACMPTLGYQLEDNE